MTGTQHEHKGELRALRVLQEEYADFRRRTPVSSKRGTTLDNQLDSIDRAWLVSPCADATFVHTRCRLAVVATGCFEGDDGNRRRPPPGRRGHLEDAGDESAGPCAGASRLARIRASQHQVRYLAWQQRHQLTAEQMDVIRAECQALTARPVISLLMPVYNISAEWLQVSIESVRQQLLIRAGSSASSTMRRRRRTSAGFCRPLRPPIRASSS